ncbi:hypothetical protein BD770DRAFT_385911 [Pilaira anomala]|nr:hypothetical protein BD770DRAFT_385911 [Pilaira anomala]
MSDLYTYTATFKNTKNRYLKYFCNYPPSKWSFTDYELHFKDKALKVLKRIYLNNLKTVKANSKNIPEEVNKFINELLESFEPEPSSSSAATVNNIKVFNPG